VADFVDFHSKISRKPSKVLVSPSIDYNDKGDELNGQSGHKNLFLPFGGNFVG